MHDLARRARTSVSKMPGLKTKLISNCADRLGFNILPRDHAGYIDSDADALTSDWMYAVCDFNTAWNEVTWPANLSTPKDSRHGETFPALAATKRRA